MLNGSFYQIANLQSSEGSIQADISFDPQHEIFKGHYPGQPVVPGACLLSLVREVLQTALLRDVQLSKADYLKFIVPVIPYEDQLLPVQINYAVADNGLLKINAALGGDMVYFKFQGWYSQ